LHSLTHLSLAGNDKLTAKGVASLLSGALPNLRVLSLSECRALGNETAEVIAGSKHAAKLRSLYLGQLTLTADGLRMLAESKHLRDLRRLSVRQHSIGKKQITNMNEPTASALAESPALAKLSYFNIGQIQLAGRAGEILKKRFKKALVQKPYEN
jgi:hypothetical protein